MDYEQKQLESALQAAQMYYYQNLPMKRIAAEMKVSHSTISRLLNWARNQGLVEIRINDLRGRSSPLEELIKLHYKIRNVKVVPVSEVAGENVRQDRVAKIAANYVNKLMESDMILGVAWGKTTNQISNHLIPKALVNTQVVQLNGGENIYSHGIHYASELVMRFASNYEARAHLFPVPTFFDYPETKSALWRERGIQRVLALQKRADLLLYSVGTFEGTAVSAVYMGAHLNERDFEEMEQSEIVGDIANIMIRRDGSYEDLPINRRACGPDLSLFHSVPRAICVVAGQNKVEALQAALTGRYLTDLIVDEPTARKLVDNFSHP